MNPEVLLNSARRRRDDEHLSQLLRYERSVHALMDAADLDGADDLLSFDNVYYRIEPAADILRVQPPAVGAQAGVFEAARARAAFFDQVGAGAREGGGAREAGAGQGGAGVGAREGAAAQQQPQQEAQAEQVQVEGAEHAGGAARSRSASKPPERGERGGGGDEPAADGAGTSGQNGQAGVSASGRQEGGTSGKEAAGDGGKNGEGGQAGAGAKRSPSIPFTKLRVWIGNSGVTECYEQRHPLLIVDNGEAEFGDYPASVFE
ncbi:unnamed protein product, partial [Anisakis simplex]